MFQEVLTLFATFSIAAAFTGIVSKHIRSTLTTRMGATGTFSVNSSSMSRIEEYFNKHMKSGRCNLFSDFDTYSTSLPVRECGRGIYLPLYQLNYYVREEELATMADEIVGSLSQYRNSVKYIAAPSSSGKSACILPAFLKTEGQLTHYLYLAFNNNNNLRFQLFPSKPNSEDTVTAEDQGAAFMFECVKRLLETPNSNYRIPRNDHPPACNETENALQKYLTEKLGENSKCLFHVDEHNCMCERNDDEKLKNNGAYFCRGALRVLARMENASVVATYIDPPPLPGERSSQVCRYPLIKPCLDINQVMHAVPELRFNFTSNASDEKRLMATLKFRLGMKIFSLKNGGIISVLHCRGISEGSETFLRNFQAAASISNNTAALEACIRLCEIDLPKTEVRDNAAAILVGLKESDSVNDQGGLRRSVPDLILINNGDVKDRLISSELRTLLMFKEKEVFDEEKGRVINVFNKGRSKFREMLNRNPNDLISGNPLELAYAWAIASRSVVERGSITFLKFDYSIIFEDVLAGRIFPAMNSSVYNITSLKPNILYTADEHGEGAFLSHPLADLFFITDDKELVLVSISGGSQTTVVRKRRKDLVEWLDQHGGNFPGYKVRGVLLAPFSAKESFQDGDFEFVGGMKARDILGGLSQVAAWMADDS